MKYEETDIRKCRLYDYDFRTHYLSFYKDFCGHCRALVTDEGYREFVKDVYEAGRTAA